MWPDIFLPGIVRRRKKLLPFLSTSCIMSLLVGQYRGQHQWHHSQEVRQRSAKSLTPVRFWLVPLKTRNGAVKKVPCKTGNQSLHGKRLPVSSFFLARVPFLGKRQRHQLVSAHGKTTQYHFSCRISCVTVYLNCFSMLLLLYIASSSGTCAY